MNLITDPWIPVVRQDGTEDTIIPWQIAEPQNPVVEIKAPRPDFQGALYQFLIGLLQTCFAPEDEGEWLEYWQEMPGEDKMQEAFMKEQNAFEMENPVGAAFMQEHPTTDKHQELFDKAEWLPIEDLIGGALSENTRKGNKDLFVKTNQIKVVSPYWAALALYNMQVTGVLAWGKHRVGLRGNAPLTTLLVPKAAGSKLWHKLWLNILYKEDLDLLQGDLTKTDKKDIFPWMGKTRTSPKKKPTSPQDANPLQHYWAMPRRIILKIEAVEGECNLSGVRIKKGVKFYKRVPDGVYYTNGWVHPLTPYIRLAKDKFPKPMVGKCAGEGCRQWISLNYDEYSDESNIGRARVVKDFYEEKPRVAEPNLWCFGYDAKSANVKCWYESIMPTFSVDSENVDALKSHVTDVIQLSSLLAKELRNSLARAWFRAQTDSSGKKKWNHVINAMNKSGHLSSYNNIEFEYWDYLETFFPDIIEGLIDYGQNSGKPLEIHAKWVRKIQIYCLKFFDENALNGLDDASNMKRIVEAKGYLFSVLYPKKKSFLKDVNEFIKQMEASA